MIAISLWDEILGDLRAGTGVAESINETVPHKTNMNTSEA